MQENTLASDSMESELKKGDHQEQAAQNTVLNSPHKFAVGQEVTAPDGTRQKVLRMTPEGLYAITRSGESVHDESELKE